MSTGYFLHMAGIINGISDFLWTYIVIAILIGCAVYFTIRTRGVQFRMIPEMFRVMLGRDSEKDGSGSRIGSFKAFSVSLASRVGTGNLAGVASAIFVGGPGAVFWMWVMAFFGAATAFVEATLAQLYKRHSKSLNSYYGGPAYYMETGLGAPWMGVLFAILMVFTFSLANQAVQSNTLTASLSDTLGVSKYIVAAVIALALFLIVSGGIGRITTVVSFMVPFMAVGYLLLSIWIIAANIGQIPEVLRLIVDNAFGIRQATGGMVGAAILQGVKRGLFSNEAGEGSAPNAAAIADTSHPVKQGLVQALGVFVDTIVICSCTAFIILLSGLYDCGQDGIMLTSAAMESHLGPVGKYFLSVAIFLFAFSTMIANYYYGETNIYFIGRKKRWPWYLRIATPVIVYIGAILELQTTWAMVDLLMAPLTLCNLTALVLLSRHVFRLLRDYESQKKAGIKEPQFHRESLPDIADKLEAWE